MWLLIFMLVPQVATQAHLEALAEIAQALSDRPLREQLRSATESEELYRALVGWQPAAR